MRTVCFERLAQSGAARRGRLRTPHGPIETPAFMPVGTGGSVKAMLPEEVRATGADVVLGNTFHLMLRPGHQLIQSLGGLHRFMNWPNAILTDSGGFQVFSLAERRSITEDGALFRSPYDGSEHMLTPERSVQVQEALGADIAMAFDEFPPPGVGEARTRASMERTTRWLDRCLEARTRPARTSLFGIVQGGSYPALREEHIRALQARDLDGYAIGGVAVGESKDDMRRTIQVTAPLLPEDRPRYLMGVGLPEDLVVAVLCGVDMFDCVIPTRNARMGRVLTWDGHLTVKNARFREEGGPIDARCRCPTCRSYSLAYLRHLWITNEITGHRLLTMHNLWHLQDLMRRLRRDIELGRAERWLPWAEARYAGAGDAVPAPLGEEA